MMAQPFKIFEQLPNTRFAADWRIAKWRRRVAYVGSVSRRP
jgi:hypothetical protein